MTAWAVSNGRLKRIDRDPGEPGPGQILVRVSCCGVCRTDLHLAEGDLPPRRPARHPGHEVVGIVDAAGAGATRFAVGERVGVAWLARDRRHLPVLPPRRREPLSGPGFTGWDVDGGYADDCLAEEAYAYRLPTGWTTNRPRRCCAPGSSATARCAAPPCPPGGRLGIYGFGGSAHLTAQVALRAGHAGARADPRRPQPRARRRLGADSVGEAAEPRPSRWTARSCSPRPGSSCRCAAPRWTAAAPWPWPASGCRTSPALDYDAELFQERRLRSVTANTRRDGEEFLGSGRAARRPRHDRRLSDGEAPRALADLRARAIRRCRRPDQLTALGGGRQQVTRPATQITEIDPACFCGRGQP